MHCNAPGAVVILAEGLFTSEWKVLLSKEKDRGVIFFAKNVRALGCVNRCFNASKIRIFFHLEKVENTHFFCVVWKVLAVGQRGNDNEWRSKSDLSFPLA